MSSRGPVSNVPTVVLLDKINSSLSPSSDWRTLAESCRGLLSTEGQRLPEENLYKLRVTDMSLDAAIHLERWTEAVEYGQKTLPVYR